MVNVTLKKIESWVNIKIDKDLPLRVSRYARALEQYVVPSKYKMAQSLKGKLKILSTPNRINQYGMQCRLATMILLQFLKEIKSNFTTSSSGFLFEDYIAGLLHSKRNTRPNSHVDFIDENGKEYQIKFYRYEAGKIKVSKHLCDYYIIGLKKENEALIWILEDEEDIKFYSSTL